MLRDDAALLDIARAAQLAMDFARGYDWKTFEDDLRTQSAVLHQISIIGEAVKRLSESFRLAHPEIPWKEIAGMRDYLVHAYDAVDLEEVWMVVNRDLPTLLQQIEPFLPKK